MFLVNKFAGHARRRKSYVLNVKYFHHRKCVGSSLQETNLLAHRIGHVAPSHPYWTVERRDNRERKLLHRLPYCDDWRGRRNGWSY